MRTFVRSIAFKAVRNLGINALSRRRMRGNLLALCYHGVVLEHKPDRFRYENTVSVDEFSEQLDFLRSHYHPISASELLSAIDGRNALPANAALLSFDDGYRNNLVAAEILREKSIPCVFFLTTNYIGTDRILWVDELMNRVLAWPQPSIPLPDGGEAPVASAEPERRRQAWLLKENCKHLPSEQTEAYLVRLRESSNPTFADEELFGFLNWDEVRTIAQHGFEIGSHTLEHPILSRTPASRLASELLESKHCIEQQLGGECRYTAYPNGGADDVSPEVFKAAREAGYRLGFTIRDHFSPPGEDALSISRLCVQGHLPAETFQFQVSGTKTLVSAGR